MTEYTQEQYQKDYADSLESLTASEQDGRKTLGGVFVGLLTCAEFEKRDAEMHALYGTGMSDESYAAYLRRCRVNTRSAQQRQENSERHTRAFFAAERAGVPHHGSTDETL